MATDIQTCYRHGERRAGVRCQRCERPICPQCMHQASVGFHCPECARSGKQKVYTARSLQATAYATIALVSLNVTVFVVDMLSGTDSLSGLNQLAADGVLFGPLVAEGEWWRPVTAGFIHYGVIHLGFNMLLLYQLGRLLEPALGRVRFLALYLLALVGGSLLVLVLSPDKATAGASGAVFGLMGAAVVAFRSRGIDPFTTGIPQLLGVNLVITFLASRYISVGGHVGGLIAGLAGGWALFELAPRMPGGKVVAPALCLLATAGLYVACIEIAKNPL